MELCRLRLDHAGGMGVGVGCDSPATPSLTYPHNHINLAKGTIALAHIKLKNF